MAKVGLVDRTIADIRLYMRENHLLPGDAFPSEASLSETLGVSRAVAREALRALAALNIVEIGNGRRARVAAPDATALSMIVDHTVYTRQLSIQQVLDVRRTLEIRTVGLAALRRTDLQAQELQAIVEKMFTCIARPDDLMELDILFHEVIARASGNSLYSIIINSFRVITRQTWHIGWRSRASDENRRENIRCHERIAMAIIAQDAARAEAAMVEHFDSAAAVLIHAGVI
ncbi:FadR/GntR family transcriptional regulator [Rhizobium halophytocola]|uniref:DNA-binding FadR family transcriptional regulator n=1 Tax=Rhizobium halophytocola TaxID=735519 RepID=A0ABS4DUU2_9HYPH|nr:FCD domain-containing protein [Rhizobium halophytocola]MBP1849458.1 DNA-binding FadR family transcriptional regulator [Rhizobium halophytocola]